MKATQFEFRNRFLIITLLYVLGFLAPWERFTLPASAVSSAWLALVARLARSGWFSLTSATMAVTIAAVVLSLLGAVLRVWGTAYLGGGVVFGGAMRAGSVVAAGPYRFLRNPLYTGLVCTSLAVAILMPPSGAVFFVIALPLFTVRLALGEEAYLASELGPPYLDYKRSVPRFLPGLRPAPAGSGARPDWLHGLLMELYAVGTAVCFAVLAWRYNAHLLMRGILISFGLSLVSRALLPNR